MTPLIVGSIVLVALVGVVTAYEFSPQVVKDAVKNFGHACYRYVVLPIEGTVAQKVNATELLDAIVAAMATGGATNILPYLAANTGWLTGVPPTWTTLVAAALVGLARLIQRYKQGAKPS